MEMVSVIAGLDSKGELDLLSGDDETVPEAELVVEAERPSAADSEETPDPCFGEGSDSGSMGSLRLPDCVDSPALRKEGFRALLYPQYVVKNTASS